MAVATIQIGQCGNQIGFQFFKDIFSEFSRASPAHQQLILSSYFHEEKKEPVANSLLVDMEPKVVSKCMMQKEGWRYDPNMKVFGQSGCGNNWAFGYINTGPSREEEIIDKLNSLIEKIDYLGGILSIQSMAGGTGSGLGTYIAEEVRDRYAKKPLLNVAVWPYSSGEIIVQNYNTVLSLYRFLYGADGVIIVDNDEAMSVCRMCYNIPYPNFHDLNTVISSSLTSVFLPCISESSPESCYWKYDFNILRNIQEKLLINPQYKLLQLKNAPQTAEKSKVFTNDTWDGLVHRLYDMLTYNSTEMSISSRKKIEKPMRSVGGMLFLRGKDSHEYSPPVFPYMHPAEGLGMVSVKDRHPAQGVFRSAGALWNSPFLVSKLSTVLKKVYTMYKIKAYVHHYEKYGLNQQDFTDCFVELESVLHNYSELQS